MQNLSGGELQRVAITLCLGQPADIYLIDEPSAYLDSEQRIIAAKVGQRSKSWSHQAKCTIHGEAIMCPYHVGLEGSA